VTVTAVWIACAVLAGLAVFQAALIAGAPIGHFAWGGQARVLPRKLRIGSAVAIAIYALFAVLLLQKAGVIAVFPDAVVEIGLWVQFAYLVLGIGANAISRSPAERLTMTPVCVVLAALVLIVAMGW
jgi:hypothetical protein